MRKATIRELGDEAKLWAFAASRPLSETEAVTLRGELDTFIAQWTSHGAPVSGASELQDQTLLLVAGEEADNPSGCSIDRLFGLLQKIGNELKVDLVDSSRIVWRDASGSIRTASRPEFRKLMETSAIPPDTTVIDLAIESVGDLRQGRLERRLADSWHAAAFAR
jgi:hypothetical protein